MGMIKLLQYDPVDQWGRHFHLVDFHGFRKFSADIRPFVSEEIIDFIKKGEFPMGQDWLVTLTNVLGASEYYSSNNNGDAFFKSALSNDGKDYGYKTFEDGHCYLHHNNSDPKHSVGKICYAHWNNRMARVETISCIRRERAGKFAERIDRGEMPSVSMGCFTAGHMVTLEDGRLKLIEDVEVGDRVLTHKGRGAMVTERHRRPYNGKLYAITTPYNATIRCTREHPLFVLHKDEVMELGAKSTWRRRAPEDIDTERAEWICAGHLEVGDYLLKPVVHEVETPDYANVALARLLGYYLAEGIVVTNKHGQATGVEFSTHVDDPIHDEIDQLAESWGARNKPVRRPCVHCADALYVTIHDRQLAELCWRHCGRHSRNKALSYSVQRWDPQLQLHFLGAYINGDGWQNAGRWQPGSVGISTASETLATQVCQMLWRNDILASVQTVRHKAGGGFNRSETTEYVTYVGRTQVDVLAEYSQKVTPVGSNRRPGGRRWLVGNYMLLPVTEITKLEYVGEVYNLEVDVDSSYVVEGYGVHNCKVAFDVCSVCGNKAPNMTKYCDHLKYAMNRILPGGQKVYADNPYPKFFDQSYVLVGADRTASHLMKVSGYNASVTPSAWLGKQAYDGNGCRKLAEEKRSDPKSADITKEVPMNLSDEDSRLVEVFIDRVLPVLERTEPTLTKDAIDALSEYAPEKVAASLLCVGMVLRPSEWASYAFQRAGREKEAAMLLGARDEDLMDLCAIEKHHIDSVDFNIDTDEADEKIAGIVEDWIPRRSAFEPHFSHRIDIAPHLPEIEKRALVSELVEDAVPDLAVAMLAYLAYRTAVPETRLKVIEEAIKKRPALLVPLLGGMLLARRAILGESHGLGASGPNYTIRTSSEKRAVNPWLTVAAPLGGAYLASTYLRGKRRQGYPLSGVGRFVEEHPGLTGLGGVYAASQLGHLGDIAARSAGKATQAVSTKGRGLIAKMIGKLTKTSAVQIALIEAPEKFLQKRYPEMACAEGTAERSS